MFATAFAVELCGTGYTLALARGNDRLAMGLSALCAILGWGLILFIVYEVQLFPAAIVGEVTGTYIALRLKKGIKGGK